LGRAIFCL